MGAVDKLNSHQCGLGAKEVGIDLIQLIPAQVIVTIAGGTGKIAIGYPVFLKGGQHTLGVFLGDGVDPSKFLCQLPLSLIAQSPDTVVYLHIYSVLSILFDWHL